jgi:radical SAM protein with 4Fe4S-binding SPASM domain
MSFISLNPIYVLKPDSGRALILAALPGRRLTPGMDDSFTNIIHPIYAMILSFIDGRERAVCVQEAANALGVSTDLIDRFVDALLDNPNSTVLQLTNANSAFPPKTIITLQQEEVSHRYDADLFSYQTLDMRMKRLFTPSMITIMFNNVCVTRCIYCYQDKSRVANCEIPLERIKELIREAHQLHVNTFDVIGGEFFLYKHWREVLQELRKYGYNPYLSTKMPLPEDDIKFLADIKIYDIQISIDTLIESHLLPSLGVKPGYVDQLIKSLRLLDHYGIKTMVNSVLTKYNDSIADMQSIYNVLKDLKHLTSWHVVKGDPTLYPKVDYNTIEISPEHQNSIADYLLELKEQSGLNIFAPDKQALQQKGEREVQPEVQSENDNNFWQRTFCSGLFSSLYILPNGDVTICEQLYWNKQFIVGNVLTQSIEEVWNSEEAKKIYFIKQEDIPADSLCHTCEHFEDCRSVRQVCYREIIKKYGKEKWYYPDVNCPFSKNKR